jgi:small subunit ribosomal protein S23
MDEKAIASRKRWRAIIDKEGVREWTRGQEYVRLWKEGIRPAYAPTLTDPVPLITPDGIEYEKREPDFTRLNE